MKHDSTNLDFFFDDELSGSDALSTAFADDEDTTFEDGEAFDATVEDEEDLPSSDVPPTEAATFADPELTKPAQERIADLFEEMPSRRKTFLSIISLCKDKQPVDTVNEYIDELQKTNHSVYSAATLCSLLERAGALTRVNEENELAAEISAEPVAVTDEDGNEYLEIPEQAPTYWLSTVEGNAAVAADHPQERMEALLADNAEYAPIYQRILELCEAEGAATISVISKAVDNDPLCKEPRRYAAYFLGQLEECEAIVWDGGWKATDLGREALSTLAEQN